MHRNQHMNPIAHRLCAWTGVLFMLVFLVAMTMVVRFVPPVSPALDSTAIARLFAEQSMQIRVATALMMSGAALGWCWSACVATWTARMEGSMPVLSFTQLLCGVFSFGGVYFAVVAWSSAAFRADRPQELVYLLSDQGWYWIVMMGSCAWMQMLAIGLAVLFDKATEPTFPRWVGYFNIWIGVLQIPGVMVAFFTTGPFAWDGLVAFWIPLTSFSAWIAVDTWAILRAIRRVESA
jgi:hypothetical protein